MTWVTRAMNGLMPVDGAQRPETLAWPTSQEAAGVQVQHPAGLGAKVRVADEDPRAMLPRLDRVAGQPAADRGRRDRRGDGPGDGLAGQFRAAPHRQRYALLGGKLAGQRLDLGHLHGCEAGRPAWPL